MLPALGGGRSIAWTTAYEWRLAGFTVWRGPEGSSRADATQVPGSVLARGNRHLGGDYTVIDTLADADTAYTYWLEAKTDDDGVLAVATLAAPPPTLVMLPIVKQ